MLSSVRNLSICALTLSLWLSPSIASAEQGSAEEGHKLAVEHCRRCHVIPGENNMGIGSTPSFKIMVRSKSANWRGKFEAFFSLRPHPNFVRIKEYRTVQLTPSIVVPIILGLDDLDDLMAYVDELAKEYRK